MRYILGLIIFISIRGASQNCDSIYHSPIRYKILCKSDFMGKADGVHSAMTYSGNEVTTIDSSNGKVYWYVNTVFFPDSSFMDCDDYNILLHEQIHLDITEVFTRRINKFLKKYQGCSVKLSKSVKKVVHQYMIDERKMQLLYDKQTRHGADLFAQNIWIETIKTELLSLDDVK